LDASGASGLVIDNLGNAVVSRRVNSDVMRSLLLKMKQLSKPVRFFLIGVGVDLVLILLFIVLVFFYYIRSYDGMCPNLFVAQNTPCSLPRYLGFYFVVMLVVAYVARWFILVIGILPPMVGLIVGSVFRDHGRA
jgi:hypothetical protein